MNPSVASTALFCELPRETDSRFRWARTPRMREDSRPRAQVTEPRRSSALPVGSARPPAPEKLVRSRAGEVDLDPRGMSRHHGRPFYESGGGEHRVRGGPAKKCWAVVPRRHDLRRVVPRSDVGRIGAATPMRPGASSERYEERRYRHVEIDASPGDHIILVRREPYGVHDDPTGCRRPGPVTFPCVKVSRRRAGSRRAAVSECIG